ncbi:helix-turn-helix domain-containing protein [Streptomyces microflavus]|uniref:helix-turn-helix domain-containing protein n=1 Tax=Streptomyces microflavus TaxID=1919 RepID=UPI00365A95FD
MPEEFDWPKPRKIASPEQQRLIDAELRRRYEDGLSIRSLVRVSGRSFGYVRYRLRASGVTLRSRGGDMRPWRQSADASPQEPL